MCDEQRVETLKSENFSAESGLCRRNQRMVDKMFKYIRSFPLKEMDVELMRKDLIGMAAEAERREEDFAEAIGEDRKKFCNQLIDAMTGFQFPTGRKFLKAAGYYCQIFAYLIFINVAFSMLTFFPYIMADKPGLGAAFLSLLTLAISLAQGLLFKTAGEKAVAYNADASKADLCMKWGIRLLIFQIGIFIFGDVVVILNGVPSGYFSGDPTAVMNWLIAAFKLFWIGLYIIGAKKNQKAL